MPQRPGLSIDLEQCFSARATLAARRHLKAPGMVRLSRLACGRCWWHQGGGSQDRDGSILTALRTSPAMWNHGCSLYMRGTPKRIMNGRL